MKVMKLKKGLRLLIAASLIASTPLWAIDKDPQLDGQIQHYWAAQAKRDWGAVYDMLTAKEQASTTRAKYIESQTKTGAFEYSDPQVKDMEIAGDMAWVNMGFNAKLLLYPNAPGHHIQIWQLWQKTDTWHPASEAERQQSPNLPPKLRLVNEETALAKRAKAAWEFKTAQDWKSFYGFLSPAYQAIVPIESFLKKKAQYLYPSSHIDWAEVAQVKKDLGVVKITFTLKPNDPAVSKLEAQEQNLVENWVNQNGEWYFDIPLPSGAANPAPAQAKPAGAKP
jgi:hypothetical protein